MTDAISLMRRPQYDENKSIAWGTPFQSLPFGFELVEQWSGRITYTKPIASAYGLPAVFMELYSPQEYLPFFGCKYGISAELATGATFNAGNVVDALSKYFGSPTSADGEKEYLLNGAGTKVLYSAEWAIEGINVSISFFSNIRRDDRGAVIATLYFRKVKIYDLVEPYMDALAQKEKEVSDPSRLLDIQFYDHEKDAMRSYEWRNEAESLESRARRFATHPRLITTPSYIAKLLANDRYAVWRYEGLKGIYVSTRNDTVCINDSDFLTKTVHWTTLTPARGCGGEYVELHGLTVHGSYQGRSVFNLVRHLEQGLECPIHRRSSPDC